MISSFILHAHPPFRLDYTVWALRRRQQNIIDQWDGQRYSRLFIINKQLIMVTIEQARDKENPELIVSIEPSIDSVIKNKLSILIEKMFGLNYDLKQFYEIALRDIHLKDIVVKFMGIKPVRFASIFEGLVNSIACQQLSLNVGIILLNRFAEKFGNKYLFNGKLNYAFPCADDIKIYKIEDLKPLGFSANKSATIIQMASAFSTDRSSFENISNQTNNEAAKFLCSYKGIGRWSAEYILLRGLGRIDIFPGDDVGARNNLQKLLHIDEKLDYNKISQITKKWYPYAGLVYFHFLLNKLSENGFITT
jgi:DNA-3-methyladenine glycosylase II